MRRKDDEKEKNISKAVIKLILELGFHGTSISKIAKEAGVSQATVYVYYENKEVMLQEIYLKYSEQIFDYLFSKLKNGMNGQQIIEILIRGYYTYINENEEIFNFVDQYSSCPSLACHCSERKGINSLKGLLEEMKGRKVIKDFNNDNLIAIIFYPIKHIATKQYIEENEQMVLLEEMIVIIQKAILL